MVGATAKPSGPPQQPPQKPRSADPQRQAGATGRKPGRLPTVARGLITIAIVWHFSGVFLAALSVGPSSPLVLELAQDPPMQWYLDLLYLNHGHSFFAPGVGPGYLVEYELLDERGAPLKQGQGKLPDPDRHRPRLRYHRHFMLADQASLTSPDRKSEEFWQRRYLEMYGRHLLRTHQDAHAVRVQRYAHWPIPREFAVQGRKLTDPEGFELVTEVMVRRSDLAPPPAAQSAAHQGRMEAAGRGMPGGLR